MAQVQAETILIVGNNEISHHRGLAWCKIINIKSQLKMKIKFVCKEDGTITCSMKQKNIHLHQEEETKMMWINVAQPIDEPSIDFTSYMKEKIMENNPNVFILSSTGSGYDPGMMKKHIDVIGGTIHFHNTIGNEPGGFCVATSRGALNGTGNSIEAGGFRFTYDHTD